MTTCISSRTEIWPQSERPRCVSVTHRERSDWSDLCNVFHLYTGLKLDIPGNLHVAWSRVPLYMIWDVKMVRNNKIVIIILIHITQLLKKMCSHCTSILLCKSIYTSIIKEKNAASRLKHIFHNKIITISSVFHIR